MKLTVDILDEFVQSLVFTGEVNSFSDDGENTTILVDETYHIRANMTIQVDGNDYTVISVVFNEQIVLEGVITDPMVYSVAPPFFYHGTPRATNSRVMAKREDNQVFPMIYLYEVFKEVEKSDLSQIVRESDLRLFFIDNANYKDWNTDDYYSYRLMGLNSAASVFIESLKESGKFYTDQTDYTRVNNIHFSTYTSNGANKNIFDQNLTAHEVAFKLQLNKCCCNT